MGYKKSVHALGINTGSTANGLTNCPSHRIVNHTMLAVDLLYIAFVMFRYVPCIPDLSKTFTMKGCWILSKAFSASNEMIMLFFFQFVYMVDYIDRFSCVEPILHLWDETYLVMVNDFFLMYSWIWFASIILSIFAFMFMREIGL